MYAIRSYYVNVDFSSEKWKTFGSAAVKEFESELSTCVSDGVGIAYLDGVNFQDGIIECDLFSPRITSYNVCYTKLLRDIKTSKCIYR